MLCLFNVHYGRWAWAAGEMPIAQQAVIREDVDLVHKLAPCSVRTLSNIYFLCLRGVLLLCKHRRASCPLAASCIYPGLPRSLHSLFVVNFPPLLFYLKAKHLRVRVWMFLVLLQLWQKGFFILLTCLPDWSWGKNTPSYRPLKMAFSHQKAKTETTSWFSLKSKKHKLLAFIYFPSCLTSLS